MATTLRSGAYWWLLPSLLTACASIHRGSTAQPALQAGQPNSEVIKIVTGDMDLNVPRSGPGGQMVMQRLPLVNQAAFTVVGKNRLRFHIQLEHKWEDWADLRGWSFVFVDDKGRRFTPHRVEPGQVRHVSHTWDYEQPTVVRDLYGDVAQINSDGWERRQPLGSVTLYRGRGDVVFVAPELWTSERRWLKLVASRSGHTFEFKWQLADSETATAPPARARPGAATVATK